MKKHLLSFALLLFLIITSKAQTSVYHPFPDSGIVWREYNSSVWEEEGPCCCLTGVGGPCFSNADYEYFLGGDTLIGSELYKKIFQTGSTEAYVYDPMYCDPGCSDITYYHNLYIGGMRQDTIQKEIFFVLTGVSDENLLYDFNLTVGDTLPRNLYNYGYSLKHVSAVDSISIGGNYHKRFWISDDQGDSNYVSLIEGIGSTFGLLYSLSAPIITEDINTLLCVTIDSIPVFPDTATVCVLATAVNEIKQEKIISLYPNPATNQLTIHPVGWSSNGLNTTSFHNEAVMVEVVDVLGRNASPPAPLQRRGEDAVIDVSGLAAGMYFLEMKSESGSVLKKFVKE